MLHFEDFEKPKNSPEVLFSSDVTGRCKVKLIDFGFLTQLDQTEELSFQSVTYVKSMRGTGFYISPEIIDQFFNPDTSVLEDPPYKYT